MLCGMDRVIFFLIHDKVCYGNAHHTHWIENSANNLEPFNFYNQILRLMIKTHL